MQNLEIILRSLSPGAALLITNPLNVRYLSNFTGSNGQILLTRHQHYFLTDGRYAGQAASTIPRHLKVINCTAPLPKELWQLLRKHRIKTLALESRHITWNFHCEIAKALPGIQIRKSKIEIETYRISKKQHEIEAIIKAQSIAEKALHNIIKKITLDTTELDLAREITALGYKYGSDGSSFTPIVAFGKHSSIPHHQNTKSKLKKGQIILIDMGMKYMGYCSDMTRTFFTKSPTRIEQQIYSLVQKAQSESISAARPGITGNELDQVARDIITTAGYGHNFTHSLGHGVGLEIHEKPSISQNSHLLLDENSVATIEPGIYLPKNFGIRLENMIIIKHSGAQSITHFPTAITDAIIKIK